MPPSERQTHTHPSEGAPSPLDHLGVIGLNWRSGGPDQLARFTLPREQSTERIRELADQMGVEELIYLATCNRVEILFRTRQPAAAQDLRAQAFAALTGIVPAPGEAARSLRAWAGEGAAEHIYLVAAGLDSSQVGETEIHGQLKRALDQALETGSLPNRGSQLETIVSDSLKLGRRLHSEKRLGSGRLSLAEIALDHLREHSDQDQIPVLMIGVSPMNVRCAKSLAQAATPCIIANRTLAKAQAFASAAAELHPGVSHTALDLDQLRQTPPAVQAILTATAADGPILDSAQLAKLAQLNPTDNPLLIIDFAVPPDVDPADVEAHNATAAKPIKRVGMDALIESAAATRDLRLAAAAEAREEIDAALGRLATKLAGEHVAPFVSALQRSYRSIAKDGAEQLLSSKLSGLTQEQQSAVLNFAEKLAGRFAHLPSTGLFGVARVAGPAAVDAFLARADRELQIDLAQAAANRPNHPS